MMFLLDTNAWIAILRNSSLSVAQRFRDEALAGNLCSCTIVLAELRHGALRSASPVANRAAVDALLAPHPLLAFDNAAADGYANIRYQLEKSGQMIGPLDIQIAAIALANDCIVVTHNVAEFRRVPGLRVEDWQAAAPE